MSKFMKSVVEEVMKPYQKPKKDPLSTSRNQGLTQSSAAKLPVHRDQEFHGINRPNYQRDNMSKRLSVLATDLGVPSADHTDKRRLPPPRISQSTDLKEFTDGPLSKLRTMSLVQGQTHGHKRISERADGKSRLAPESKLVGQTMDGIKAWLFTGLEPSLEAAFQRPLKSYAIGVVTADKCTVGQLFLVNEILREFPALKYCLTWDRESRNGFVLELYEQDSNRLAKAVKSLYDKLSKKSYQAAHVFKTKSPGPWLTKQLNVKAPVEGITVLEGIDYYSAVLLLDQYLKKSPEQNFGYLIEKTYLLLHGHYDTIAKAVEELKKEAEK